MSDAQKVPEIVVDGQRAENQVNYNPSQYMQPFGP